MSRKTLRGIVGGGSRLARSRLFGGIGANVYGQAVTLVIQFGSVPVLLHAWGAKTYGLWLLISAIPSYFALADFGFSSAAGNDMTLAAAAGLQERARSVFQSVVALNILVAIGLAAIVLTIVPLVPDRFLPQTALVSSAQVRLVWILQTFQVAATLSCGAFGGGFQSSGRYALGLFLASSARLADNFALVGGAWLFHGLAPAAGLMLATRIAALVGMAALLPRGAPWLRIGFQAASPAEIRRLTKPALAVLALPAAFAVSLQGFVLVIGACLSLDAVAVFSTVRTMTRSVIQAGNIVNSAIMPEVTRAFGGGDALRVRRLLRINFVSVAAINLATLGAVATFGVSIVAHWTRGRIAPDWILVFGLALVASLHGFWLSQANLILAVNRHAAYSYWSLVVCMASVIAAIPTARGLGVDGLWLPLLVSEGVMILVVAPTFRAVFRERPGNESNVTLQARAAVKPGLLLP